MFVFSHNIFVLPPQEIIFPLSIILISTTGLFFCLRACLKNSKKSGILITLYLFLFFSFGHIYNILQGITISEFEIGRYRYLIIPYIGIFLLGTVFILRTKKTFVDITKIVNIISIVLIISVFGSILSDSLTESSQILNLSEQEDIVESYNISQLETKQGNFPNVYYIILDEYGSEESLNRFFDYDNQEFLSYLKQKGFFVVENSFSNYPSTKLSLGSTLNMKYLEHIPDKIGKESKNHHMIDQILMDNFVMQNFKSNGYEIINMGALWGPHNEFKSADNNLCENKEMNRDSLTRELIGWIIKSLKILIFILGLAAVLELWGIKIGPIIAGLGLFGVAVALGAQDLFKNLISGILVLVEKRFKIGDWISVEGIIEGIVEKIGFRSTTIRKFDKSLAIIPNFQFAENAVVNVSETSNWLISWIITLQYDTTVDQLKTIRNQIEEHINKSEDFNTSIGIAVRVDKFSDSSIDMYVRCFTNSNSWNDWLSVKEKLAIAIKQIVENNKASFAFPSSSIYIEKK